MRRHAFFSSPAALHTGLIILVSCLLMAPAFIGGARGSDVIYHSVWIKQFAAQLWHGDLYPRWLMDADAGRGSPAFFYYPPMAYFITSLFISLAPLDPFAYDAMAASSLLAVLIGGITFYFWMRKETGDGAAALLGSLLYVTMPREIAWNFYYSFLFSSVWAYAWIPLLLMAAKAVALRKPFAVPFFALMLALLITTSLPMTVVWGPVAVAYGVLHFDRARLTGQGIALAAAVVLGFGLAAIFLLPALSYMDFVMVKTLWNARGGYDRLFLRPGFRVHNQTIVTILFAVMGISLIAYWRALPKNRQAYFFLGVSLVTILLTTPLAKPVWDAIPLLGILEAPERFLGVPALTLAALAALAAPRMRYIAYVAIAFYAAVTFITVQETPATQEIIGTDDNPYTREMYDLNIEQYYNYLAYPALMQRYYTQQGIEEVKDHPDQVETASGDAKVAVTLWKPRHITLHYKGNEPSTLRIRQFFYPGWGASEGEKEIPTTREERTGQVLIDVPAGEGDVTVELAALLPEILGKIISMASAAAVLLLTLLAMRARRVP